MHFSRKSLGIPYAVFLLLFVIAPLLVLFYYAFTDGSGQFTLMNLTGFFMNPNTMGTMVYSFALATVTTVVCVALAYPLSYILATSRIKSKTLVIMIFVMPMWINFSLRITAMKEILSAIEGNLAMHPFLNAVIGMTYDFLPFMILPIYTAIAKLDPAYLEAAEDLGANPRSAFIKVTLPLSMPGVISGVMMVFLPAMTNYVVLDMLWRLYDCSDSLRYYLPLYLPLRYKRGRVGERRCSAVMSKYSMSEVGSRKKSSSVVRAVFFVFMLLVLYMPILILALYSFTDATNIGATPSFTLRNYHILFTSEDLRTMIIGTLSLAVGSSVIATILGTMGAIGAFYSKNRMRRAIASMNQIPVVNADVVTGFSVCVLLVVVLGINKETYIPLVIGHVVLSAPFVYLSVLPKLKQMDPSLYEAALDLGATPFRALRQVVLPQLMSGIVSGFGLAITLSLDDYFIATYTKPATFNTISTYVVNATKGSNTTIKTALWALSTVIFLIVLLIVIIGNLRTRRRELRREE